MPSLVGHSILIRVLLRFSFALTVNVMDLFLLATVFSFSAYKGDKGDLNRWDVSKVNDMSYSKSTPMVEEDLT